MQCSYLGGDLCRVVGCEPVPAAADDDQGKDGAGSALVQIKLDTRLGKRELGVRGREALDDRLAGRLGAFRSGGAKRKAYAEEALDEFARQVTGAGIEGDPLRKVRQLGEDDGHRRRTARGELSNQS